MGSAADPAAHVALAINSIRVGPRLRAVDAAAVANLQTSIRETGFFGAILVRPMMDDELGPQYDLVAGAHRLAAMKAEGRLTIPSSIRVLSDDEALQIEIDENLVRRGLTPLERAEMVEARFKVWARRHPDRVKVEGGQIVPKRGRPSNSDILSQFQCGAPEAMGFAAETAAEIGLAPKSIKRAWATVSGLPADLRARLHGTPVAKNEGLLRQLAALGDREEQAKVADVLISGATKSVSDARALAAGNTPVRGAQTPVDETLKAFRKVWGAASPSARAAILHDVAGRALPQGWSVTQASGTE